MALSKPLNARQLYWACYQGKIEKVKAHGALGGDLNLRAGANQTGLMGAAYGGQRDVVEWLVRAPGIEIDAQDGRSTPQHAGASGPSQLTVGPSQLTGENRPGRRIFSFPNTAPGVC